MPPLPLKHSTLPFKPLSLHIFLCLVMGACDLSKVSRPPICQLFVSTLANTIVPTLTRVFKDQLKGEADQVAATAALQVWHTFLGRHQELEIELDESSMSLLIDTGINALCGVIGTDGDILPELALIAVSQPIRAV